MEMEKHFSRLSLETLEQTREGQNALPPRTTLGRDLVFGKNL